jgi:hypothetical protein
LNDYSVLVGEKERERERERAEKKGRVKGMIREKRKLAER